MLFTVVSLFCRPVLCWLTAVASGACVIYCSCCCCLFLGSVLGDSSGQLCVITRCNYTLFNETVNVCCAPNNTKVGFVGVRNSCKLCRGTNSQFYLFNSQPRSQVPLSLTTSPDDVTQTRGPWELGCFIGHIALVFFCACMMLVNYFTLVFQSIIQ